MPPPPAPNSETGASAEEQGQGVLLNSLTHYCRPLALPVMFIKSKCSELVLVLSAWFIINFLITLYNKAVFQFIKFNYPFITTAIHLTFTLIGVSICQKTGVVPVNEGPGWDKTYVNLVLFSLVYSGNIWLATWSTLEATLPLNQILRSSVPLFTVVFNTVIFRDELHVKILPPIFVVILGCFFTVSGDLSTTTFGLILVIVSCAFSSFKGIVTQKSQVNAGLNATDVLRYMCPLAIAELLVGAYISGEIQELSVSPHQYESAQLWLILSFAGLLAFSVNVVSFRACVVSDPLTMNVLANVKQVMTSLIAIPIFGTEPTLALITGVVVACAGSYWYGLTANQIKAKAKQAEARDLDINKDIIALEVQNDEPSTADDR